MVQRLWSDHLCGDTTERLTGLTIASRRGFHETLETPCVIYIVIIYITLHNSDNMHGKDMHNNDGTLRDSTIITMTEYCWTLHNSTIITMTEYCWLRMASA